MTVRLPQVGASRSGRSKAANAAIKAIPHIPAGQRQIATSSGSDPKLNRLLAMMPLEEWQRCSAELELTDMPLGKVLARAGEKTDSVHFPTTAIVSLQYITADGSLAEIAAVGNDGVVGVSLFMGGGSTLLRAVVRSAGQGYRLNAGTMLQVFSHSAVARRLFLLYTQALITQMAQTVVCNRHHSIDQQLCRWLLDTEDRTQGSELLMTHELIAYALGVRREGITGAAVHLQKAGLVSYARGHLRILDRQGLEDRVCECYSTVAKEYSRLLCDPPPASERCRASW
jgi:CRP-like cAMP-binding protein